MKMMIAIALILSSSAGLAQTAATGSAAANAKPPKPICRSEPVTGSIFPQRSCHSKEEWTAIDAANAANAERMSAARNAGGSTNH
ncbi:hypothetical protein FSB78_11540 [Sphingomonas ginsenosidivorax]|uniref:Uncharacterized protein n=1 Tax=Sphingomonas ginsenosidivorax TaxID=862135 RepID=A0A5C6UHI2_9SPHN|nr:hypothetical protein [Sphingomonas ginsenosidivorax]TXC71505.1 hypothetical protein FSB78_11540 [Sphingomonas ginsenosidivorax]